MDKWDQESNSGIGVVLRHRTKHHHRVSKIGLNKDLQRVDLEWLLKSDKFLTSYGKQKIKEDSQRAFDKWHKENFKKIENTKNEILDSLNNTAKNILGSDINILKSLDPYMKEFPELF